jgi:pyruvate dehydrogenase E1 component beta subunit
VQELNALVYPASAVRGAAQVVAAKKKEIMMWEALREATDEEMERDPTVCVMGEAGWGWASSGVC